MAEEPDAALGRQARTVEDGLEPQAIAAVDGQREGIIARGADREIRRPERTRVTGLRRREVLDDHDRLEEGLRGGQGQEPLDLCEADVPVTPGLERVALDLLEPLAGRAAGIDLDSRRQGGDEQPHHALDPQGAVLAAGHRRAENDVARPPVVAQQERPRRVREAAERQALLPRERTDTRAGRRVQRPHHRLVTGGAGDSGDRERQGGRRVEA